jgi:hypothetical protein
MAEKEMRGDIRTDEILQDLNVTLATILTVGGWEPHEYNIWTKDLDVIECGVHYGHGRYDVSIGQPIRGGKQRWIGITGSSPVIDSDKLWEQIAEVSS